MDPATFPSGWTSGEVTVFNSNGGWTWYNDERVVVDAEAGKIIVSSAESDAADQSANPNIDAVIYDLATGANDKMKLGSLPYSDDHNNGGILVLGSGKYFVGWAHHNKDCISHWRNYEDGAWGAEQTFDWTSLGCPWAPPEGSSANPSNITYNNPWKVDGRYYNFVRAVESSPSILASDDGKSWAMEGRLTASPRTGYNAGYYKFWGNNVDRVDFFATEAHPRDADTSVYHGYVQGTKSYDSSGALKDDNILDGEAPQITEFTPVFTSGTTIAGGHAAQPLEPRHRALRRWNARGPLAGPRGAVRGQERLRPQAPRPLFSLRWDGVEVDLPRQGWPNSVSQSHRLVGGGLSRGSRARSRRSSRDLRLHDHRPARQHHRVSRERDLEGGDLRRWRFVHLDAGHHELGAREPASRRAQMGCEEQRPGVVPRQLPNGADV
jgi:hypothetical protein